MQYRELAAMHAVESTHWWFVGKRTLFRRLLGNRLCRTGLRILDVGCGTGAVARDFSRYGTVYGADRSLDALLFARSSGLEHAVAAVADGLPFPDQSFDLVLAFDVLEHVADDRATLDELRRVVRRAGAVAVHVPAWPFLWSTHDTLLGHERRYTRRALRHLLDDAGFRIEHLGWASAAIFPPAVALRLARRLSGRPRESADIAALPAPLNALMRGLYQVEAELAARTGLPFGLSLAAIVIR